MNYRITVTETIINTLKANLKPFGIKEYFNGNINEIGQSQLPCICVVKLSSEPLQGPTGMDKRQHTILVRVIYNKKDEFGKASKDFMLQKTLEKLMEGIDTDTGEYAIPSVLGILRRNFTLGSLVCNNNISISYTDNTDIPNNYLYEARATCVFDELLTVTPRA